MFIVTEYAALKVNKTLIVGIYFLDQIKRNILVPNLLAFLKLFDNKNKKIIFFS